MFMSTEMTSVSDKERLLQAVNRTLGSWMTYAPYLDFFRRKLRRSQAVPVGDVPNDVITMNSRFALLDDHTGETICYTLVYPEDTAPHQGRVSVLSPMGTVLYGAKVGEKVCWMASSGPQVATVKRLLYQPEAAGHDER
jgi:regulator of nucleoside diphosphate kinase